MAQDDTTAARGAADLEALRAAVARIEQGEPTGFFDGLERAPADAPARAGSTRREREPVRQTKKAVLSDAVTQIDAALPEGARQSPSTGAGQDQAARLLEPYQVLENEGEQERAASEQAPQLDWEGASELEPEREASEQASELDREGAELEPERDADPYAVARAIVLRQLTMSPKSRDQLRKKLRERNCPDDVAEAVLDRMIEVGLVDDEKYAEAYVRSKQVSRGLSKRALAHELRTKGVDRDTAEAVLAEVSPVEEEERARSLVEARLPRLRDLERNVVIRRLAGMLARKGYPSGLSLQVIREAIDADPAFRRD